MLMAGDKGKIKTFPVSRYTLNATFTPFLTPCLHIDDYLHAWNVFLYPHSFLEYPVSSKAQLSAPSYMRCFLICGLPPQIPVSPTPFTRPSSRQKMAVYQTVSPRGVSHQETVKIGL